MKEKIIMKLIRNKILIDLKNSEHEYLLINLLYCLVDVLTKPEFDIIQNWENVENIVPNGNVEEKLFEELKKRRYFLSSDEENNLRKNIIQSHAIPLREKLTYSKSASFIFSYACNFACPYCYEKDRDYNHQLMTKDMIDSVFDLYVYGINHIGFFGGEPLLPQNEPLIRYITSKAPNAYYTIITNGYYLDYYLPLMKTVNLAMVQITLDGRRNQHNKTRILKNGKPTYDKIIKNIELFLDNKIKIKIRMNLSKDNFRECYEERNELIAKFGNENLSFEMQPLFEYSYSEQSEFITKMLKNDKDDSVNNIIWKTLPPLSNFIFNKVPLRPITKFCESENQNRFYDCYGNIYSCILSVGEKEKSIGSYYPTLTLKDNSLLTYDITQNPKCNECNYALICGGGCPYHIMNEKGNIIGTNCSNIKNEIENLIPMLYQQIYEKK